VDAYFAAAVAGHDSAVRAVARVDSVLVRKGYGQANSELGRAGAADTRYMIGLADQDTHRAAVLRRDEASCA